MLIQWRSPMHTECTADLFALAPVQSRAVVTAFDSGAITSDAGALLLAATDRAIRLIVRVAACLQNAHSPEHVKHTVPTLVGQHIVALALGYEDLIDHDQLRHDPILAVLAGKFQARRSDYAPLAGKSTLNRLEHAPLAAPSRYHQIRHDAHALERLFKQAQSSHVTELQ